MIKSAPILLIIILFTFHVYGQSIKTIKFTYSHCLDSIYGEPSSVIFQKNSENTLIIKLRTYAPCNDNLAGGVEIMSANTVNLTFKVKPTLIKDKKGKVHELLEIADCTCLFDFQYEVQTSIDLSTKTILVNNESLEEIIKRDVKAAEKVPLDEEIKNE
jgi:hypothetical protein